MIQADALAAIANDDLFVTVQRLTARWNVALADLLAHLGEVERRGIHRLRACASLYTYCIYELRMSEDAAYRRSKAARLVREYPELHDAIANGELHLTGVRLIAEIDPKPDVPALIEPIGPAPAGRATHAAFMQALAAPVRELAPGSRPADWIAESADSTAEEEIADGVDSASEGGTADGADSGDSARRCPRHAIREYWLNFRQSTV